MSVLSVDIETVPDENKRQLFKRFTDYPNELIEVLSTADTAEYDNIVTNWQNSQMSLSPDYCQIVGLNLMGEGHEPTSHWVGQKVNSKMNPGQILTVTETDLLRKFWKIAQDYSSFVTFNGISFDLEVIKARSAELHIPPTVNFANLKPWEDKVIDLMKRLFANRKVMGLKKLRRIYWLNLVKYEPGMVKYDDLLDMDGGQVYELFKAGDYETLTRYGEFDAITNMALYRFGKGYWW